MPSPRRLALALLAALVLVTGCGTPQEDGTPAPEPSPTASVDVTATTGWAETVCTRIEQVRGALDAVGDGLEIDPLGGEASLENARIEVDSQIAEVGRSFAELRAAVDAAPDDPTSQEAKASLDRALTTVETNGDEAMTQARAVFDAGSAAAAAVAATGAFNALQDATAGLGDLVGVATGSASGASEEVRRAFAQAPACEGLTA